jgi:regulatory protein
MKTNRLETGLAIQMTYTITGLKVQNKNHQRVNVYLDGEFAFGLRRIVAAWLNVGQVISDEKIAQLKSEDAHEEAYQRALRFIDYRPRSSTEIRQSLKKKDLPEELIDEVVERLERNGFLDDSQFAQLWVENQNEFRPRGKRALAYELRSRGIENQVIDQTLQDLDEGNLAYQAANKRARRWKDCEWTVFRQKLLSFLTRRGFNYETSMMVTERVWSEIREEDPVTNIFENEVEETS